MQGQQPFPGLSHARIRAHVLATAFARELGVALGILQAGTSAAVQHYLTIQAGRSQQHMLGRPCTVTWHINI
jgi:hypothetical protein